MIRLLVFLKKYKTECFLGPLFKLIEAAFELTVPLVVANMIDHGIETGNRTVIYQTCGILIVFAASGLLCALAAQFFAAKAAVGFCTDVRHVLFAHIGRFSYTELDRIGTPTLITRMTGDVNQVQVGLNLALRLLLRSPFVVFGAVLMAFLVDAKAAWVFAAAVPLLLAVVFAIMLICIPLYKKVQKKLDALLAKTRENLQGARVIRAFCKEEDEIGAFHKRNDLLTEMQIAVGKISAFLNPVTFVLINLAVAVLIYTGALRVEGGALTKGSVVALYNYMSQILVELIKLASLIISITKAIASGNRIQAVLDIKPDMPFGKMAEGDRTTPNAVEFQNASLSYGGGERALAAIDLALPRGKTVGIIGSTGSGKSSLVHLIPRFYEATEGAVLVDGVNVREYTRNALREKIGIVPQKTVLFQGTIRDNIRFGKPDATDEEILAALSTAQADGIIREKTGGLDFIIEQDGRNLSGGQRQRLAIARALVRKPEILILDDSASALDYVTAANLMKALRNMGNDMTVLIVSQRISALKNAQTLVVLDNGRVVGIGTEQELLKSCEVFREIYHSQTERGGEQ